MDGYKIIDFGGITIDSNDGYDNTIDGIYNAVDISTKPMVFTGINGVKPFYAMPLTKTSTGPNTYTYEGMLGFIGSMWFISIADNNRVIISGQ